MIASNFKRASSNRWHSFFFYSAIFIFFVWLRVVSFQYNNHDFFEFEALISGNIADSINSGVLDSSDIDLMRFVRREGSEVLLAHFFALFFQLFGSSYYTLNLASAFLDGFWPIAWLLVFSQMSGTKRNLIAALLFITATPLIHGQNTPVLISRAHLGASTLCGFSLYFLLKACSESRSFIKLFLLAVSALTGFIALYFGYISVFALFGMMILFFKPGLQFKALWWWSTFFILAFLLHPSILGSMDLEFFQSTVTSPWYTPGSSGEFLGTISQCLLYFGGLRKNSLITISDLIDSTDVYSVLNVFFIVFFIISIFYYLFYSCKTENRGNVCFKFIPWIDLSVFLISTMALIVVVGYYKNGLSTSDYDGLRYLIPIVPYYLIILSYLLLSNKTTLISTLLITIFIGFNLFAFIVHIYPMKNRSPIYKLIKGSNMNYMLVYPEVARIQEFDKAPDSMIPGYAFMSGRAYFIENLLNKKINIENFPERALKYFGEKIYSRDSHLLEIALLEFKRGYYFELGLKIDKKYDYIALVKKQEKENKEIFHQGFAMGVLFREYDESSRDLEEEENSDELEKTETISNYEMTSKQYTNAVLWGYGRILSWRSLKLRREIIEKLKKHVIDNHGDIEQFECWLKDGFSSGWRYDYFSDPSHSPKSFFTSLGYDTPLGYDMLDLPYFWRNMEWCVLTDF